MSKIDLAYMAGIFDGEGCIFIGKTKSVKTNYYAFADRCTPPLPHADVDKCVDSITKRDAITLNGERTLSPLNSDREDFTLEKEFSYERLQATLQVGDKLSGYGDLTIPFDKFLKENPEPHWKRDVAEIIGRFMPLMR